MTFLQSLVVSENILFLFVVFFLVRFIIFSILEDLFVAHPFDYKTVFVSDVVTMLSYTLIIFPIAQYLSNTIGIQGTILSHLLGLPFAVRILLFFVIADFLHYWIHRLMHQPFLWSVHKWHHSMNHMSWLGGFRATVFDTLLINLAFIFAWPILGHVSYGLMIFILICNILFNDWMHLNVRFRLPLLEKIIVTPRYHHIHHSTNKEHYTKNVAALFPLWDKLFGTYVDPDSVHTKLTFGLEEKVSTPRLIIGV